MSYLQDGLYPRPMANAIRALAMDAVERAQSGHPGMPMGMADVATVLFARHLKFDPRHPRWPDRDRFILSAGHGSMLLYALLHLTGYEDMTIEALQNFRQIGSLTPGHPEYGHTPGVETTTGPLGQGLATAVGMALAERLLHARFGEQLVDHRTYVIAGDGCLMEGVSQEAISLAGHLRLNRLTVLWDDNRVSIDGPTDLTWSEDQMQRFRASGWTVTAVDGHNAGAIDQALTQAHSSECPSLIACRTIIGFGAPNKAGTAAAHGSPLGLLEITDARAALDWPYDPFDIPAPIRAAWATVGARGKSLFDGWSQRLDASAQALAFEKALSGAPPDALQPALAEICEKFLKERPRLATRQASQMVLEAIAPVMDGLVGGSADLTGSNLTRATGMATIEARDYRGQYLYYGVREHGMAALMNGLALHGGFLPYGGSFLCFTDYARPAIRLAALMKLQLVYVMSHDSIGQGEDGPTHQPVEHLASLRAMPGLRLLRPADPVETVECWTLALTLPGPSVLALTRQAVATLPREAGTAINRSSRGAYVFREAEGPRAVTLLATGSELALALAAQEELAAAGLAAAVVSMPCWDLFEAQETRYKAMVLGDAPRVAVEAMVRFGWDRYIGAEGAFVGMDGFGASGPGAQLYEHFGITKAAIVQAAKAVIAKTITNTKQGLMDS